MFDIEAIDLLTQFARQGMSRGDLLEQFVLDWAGEHETRPSAAQTAAAGHEPGSTRSADGSWFGLLDRLDVLEGAEAEVQHRYGDLLRQFQAEPITKAYKLVTIRAMLRAGTLRTGMPVTELAAVSQSLVAADPRLVADARSKSLPEPADADAQTWERFWRQNPLDHLAKGDAPLFRYDGDRFVPTFDIEDRLGDAFDAMVAEIIEWRLADYLLGPADSADGDALEIRGRVSHSAGTPVVRFSGSRDVAVPQGNVALVADGTEYVGRFIGTVLDRLTSDGSETNVLPTLLRGWFSHDAGLPGTRNDVLLRSEAGSWALVPDKGAEGLEQFVGERFTRQQVRELFDATTTGNWQEGHIPIPAKASIVLFVTLDKQGMSAGTEYHDYFESPEVFVWTSQNSTEPTNKRGRSILNAEADETSIHLFVRSNKKEPFEYMGTVLPISHEGAKPMTVRFLLTHPADDRVSGNPQ